MESTVQRTIESAVKSTPIIMYVKGDKDYPQCGFSKRVIDIFLDLGVDFTTVDVLSDPDIRDGIKQFTKWPTIPQVFINGEFVGGCDIVTDLYASGELAKMVAETKKA